MDRISRMLSYRTFQFSGSLAHTLAVDFRFRDAVLGLGLDVRFGDGFARLIGSRFTLVCTVGSGLYSSLMGAPTADDARRL